MNEGIKRLVSELITSCCLHAIVMIFTRLLFTLAVPLTMAQKPSTPLVDAILDISQNSTCPGMVLVLAEERTVLSQESLLEEFEKRLKKPVTLVSKNVSQSKEFICNDAVIIYRNETTELLSLYRQLRNSFYLNKVMIVIDLMIQVDRFLEELKNERVQLMIESINGSLEIRKWSVNQDRVVSYHQHSSDVNNKSLSDGELLIKLSGRHLKVATLHHPPAVVIRSFNSSSELAMEGIEPSIMNLIADQLNFTIDYVLAPANEMWGDVVRDPSTGEIMRFTGIRGMLMRKEVDLAFGDLYVMSSWLSYISFSQNYKMDYECFVVPRPKSLASWTALILPFSLKTWLATLTSLVLVTVALAAKNDRSIIESSFFFALGQLLWIQQPRFPNGKTPTGNLFLILSWLFAATILSTVYRSGLISFLTHPFAQQPINTIQQLVDSPLNKIMFESDFYQRALSNSTDPFRRRLGQQLRTTNNMTQMMDLLKTSDWAVDSSLDSLNYLLNDHVGPSAYRDLHIMKEKLFPTRSSFGLQKDSPLKSRVDLVLQRLIEAGLVDYHRSYLNKPIRRRPGVIHDHQHRQQKTYLIRFSLNNLQGAFYILGIGVFISTLTFALELIISIFP